MDVVVLRLREHCDPLAGDSEGVVVNEGLTYIAQPYSHDDPAMREWRYQQALKAAAKLMLQGRTVFSPIAHTHPIERETGKQSHEFWLLQDIAVLRHAAKLVVLMLPGWKDSKGVAEEIAVARANKIPIEMMAP